ncbi:hypothetical protein K461DRAFT_324738 [Myriangium duriaei CBS 260.36]|uniref:VWFD domain-containing protein n=1 Tax=Myriangium duriaei CBS 260.36 TaxID=1168546 RepID=A0A9P4MCN7_9PEZI|nr:hypothetical protein K461DRAFT_324738 [Myriangium duriaei CBS 260.36]
MKSFAVPFGLVSLTFSQTYAFPGVQSRAEPAGCAQYDEAVRVIRLHVTNADYFCNYFLAGDRSYSPLPAQGPAVLVSHCTCLLQEDNKTIPKANSAILTKVPALSSVTCNAKYQALVQSQYALPSSLCSALANTTAAQSPISGMTVTQVMEGCKCILPSPSSSTTISTTTTAKPKPATTSSRTTTKTTTTTITKPSVTTTTTKGTTTTTTTKKGSTISPPPTTKPHTSSTTSTTRVPSSSKASTVTSRSTSTTTKASTTTTRVPTTTTTTTTSPSATPSFFQVVHARDEHLSAWALNSAGTLNYTTTYRGYGLDNEEEESPCGFALGPSNEIYFAHEDDTLHVTFPQPSPWTNSTSITTGIGYSSCQPLAVAPRHASPDGILLDIFAANRHFDDVLAVTSLMSNGTWTTPVPIGTYRYEAESDSIATARRAGQVAADVFSITGDELLVVSTFSPRTGNWTTQALSGAVFGSETAIGLGNQFSDSAVTDVYALDHTGALTVTYFDGTTGVGPTALTAASTFDSEGAATVVERKEGKFVFIVNGQGHLTVTNVTAGAGGALVTPTIILEDIEWDDHSGIVLSTLPDPKSAPGVYFVNERGALIFVALGADGTWNGTTVAQTQELR